jgi:hypothetical protein
MNVIEREMLRAKKSEYLNIAAAGSLGVVGLFSAALESLESSVHTFSAITIYGGLLFALFGIWFPAIRGYRSAALSDGEIIGCQNAVAIRPKKKPSQESP